MYLAGWLRVN